MPDINDYTPDNSNANKGTERGQEVLDNSLAETGFGRSIVVDKEGRVVAGNKTLAAAIRAGQVKVREVETDGSELVVVRRRDFDLYADDPNNPARRYAYYDNRAGELGLQWDADQLALDVQAGFDFGGMFEDWELGELTLEPDVEDDFYSRKVERPIYEPNDRKPSISALYDSTVTDRLIEGINARTDITSQEKDFLIAAAYRHTKFNFSLIADYYANSSAAVQRLMEFSALVVVDFNQAIELGFVNFTKRLQDLNNEG